MIKKGILLLFNLYQFFSKLIPGKCRYYPTCSEYGKWQFETNSLGFATFFTLKRILSCNQLFAGGIDYPRITSKLPYKCGAKIPLNKVKYWYIPINKTHFHVIKNFDYGETNETNP